MPSAGIDYFAVRRDALVRFLAFLRCSASEIMRAISSFDLQESIQPTPDFFNPRLKPAQQANRSRQNLPVLHWKLARAAYLKTKFVIFLVASTQVLKQRQIHPRRKNPVSWYSEQGWEEKRGELSWNSFEYVPFQDFSKSWTDAELYKEYELDQDEIAFIETNIKAIEDDDCDGLSGDKEVSHV